MSKERHKSGIDPAKKKIIQQLRTSPERKELISQCFDKFRTANIIKELGTCENIQNCIG